MTRHASALRPGRRRATFGDHVRHVVRYGVVVAVATMLGAAVGVVVAQLLTGSNGSEQVQGGAVGFLSGLVVGVSIALVLAHRRPRIETVEDVRRATGLPVVGQLPGSVRRGDDPETGSLSPRARTTLRETVQNMRTLRGGSLPAAVLLARTDAVREAAGVDGGFARALVELGSSCALVQADFDARAHSRPSTLSDSALPEEVASDRAGYDRVPVPDDVIAATRSSDRSGADHFFDGLKRDYDVSVALASTDSHPLPLRSITGEADEVLLVARSGVTSVESLTRLAAELAGLDVLPIGVVLTGIPAWRRVLLRSTWHEEDFRSAPREPAAGPSIAQLAFLTADDAAPRDPRRHDRARHVADGHP